MRTNDRSAGYLRDLRMRPATYDLHQIRYWSALDDPREAKWNYSAQGFAYTALTEASSSLVSRPASIAADPALAPLPSENDASWSVTPPEAPPAVAYPTDWLPDAPVPDEWAATAPRKPVRQKKPYTGLIIGLSIALVLILGTAGFFILRQNGMLSGLSFSGAVAGNNSYAPVKGYIVKLGQRELGIVEDKAAVETYAQTLLQQATELNGRAMAMKQALTFSDEMTVDALYVANVEDVQAAIARHAVFE